MKSLDDLPPEVIHSIIFFIRRPLDHLSFFRSCPAVCRAYNSKICQALCVGYGFGRPYRLRRQSWVANFFKVMAHAKNCLIPACSWYGVPPSSKCWKPANRLSPHNRFSSLAAHTRCVHDHLTRLGDTTLDNFIAGMAKARFQSDDDPCTCGFRQLWPVHREGAHWANEELSGETWDELCKMEDHPVLAQAFCCQPPVAAVNIHMDVLDVGETDDIGLSIRNGDGVTISDVIDSLRAWFKRSLSGMDRVSARNQLMESYHEDECYDSDGDELEEGEKCQCMTYDTYREFLDFCRTIPPGQYDRTPQPLRGIWSFGPNNGQLDLEFVVDWEWEEPEIGVDNGDQANGGQSS